MSSPIKGVSFIHSDQGLVNRIETFQHKKQCQSFTDAVRKLCEMGLEVEKSNEKNKSKGEKKK